MIRGPWRKATWLFTSALLSAAAAASDASAAAGLGGAAGAFAIFDAASAGFSDSDAALAAA